MLQLRKHLTEYAPVPHEAQQFNALLLFADKALLMLTVGRHKVTFDLYTDTVMVAHIVKMMVNLTQREFEYVADEQQPDVVHTWTDKAYRAAEQYNLPLEFSENITDEGTPSMGREQFENLLRSIVQQA